MRAAQQDSWIGSGYAARECFGEAWGGLFYPRSANVHTHICMYISGEAWEAWGGLGNALGRLRGGLGRLGECLGMLRGGSGRLGDGLGNAL